MILDKTQRRYELKLTAIYAFQNQQMGSVNDRTKGLERFSLRMSTTICGQSSNWREIFC